MLRKLALALGLVLALFLGYIAVKPSDYEISREITIRAPAERIFPYLTSMKLADEWGPWKDVDPAAKFEYSGPESGIGSKEQWSSGTQLGTGSATITEIAPNERVAVHLSYSQPMPMEQDAEYLLKAQGSETVMTWKVRGKNSFMGRLLCVFVNMDKMVGSFFEKGLSKLKTIAESQGGHP